MKLWPYQEKAVEFLTKQRRAYLAMDMGCGKTITSIAAAEGAGKRHILLIAEKNEIVNSQNFKKEVERHFDGLSYYSLRDSDLSDTEGVMRSVWGINPDALVKHDVKKIQERFDTMVIDEATMAKTTTSKRFKGVHKIAKAMDYVYLLSGTPMMNGAAEIYAPLLLLDHPMVAGKGASGREAFETIFAGGHRRKIRNTGIWFKDYVWWAKGANHVRELRWLIRDHFFFMQKGQTDVFKHKERRVEYVSMGMKWLAEYTQAWEEYYKEQRATRNKKELDNINELRNLIENGKMYQVNSKWKARRVAQDIADGKYGDRRIVVFTMFVESDEIMQAELKRLGLSFRTFEDIKEWKSGNEQVLVGRIKAHGKGSNIPEASVALFVDMDFVPANNIQAENRIDRPEQKNEMEIVYYITEGDDVIDAHVRGINMDKSRKIDKFMQPLTEEELAVMPGMIKQIRIKYPKQARLLEI